MDIGPAHPESDPNLQTDSPGLPASLLLPLRNPLGPRIEYWLLQIAHRLGAVGFLLALGSLVMVYLRQDFKWAVAIGFLASDVGFCAALAAWMLARRQRRTTCRREAFGAVIFNLIFLVLSLQMILLDRMDLIRSIARRFFSAS